MIRSMTGYGRGVSKHGDTDIVVELRAVNRNSLEISSRFPQDYQFLETGIRKIVQKKLSRGQINVSIQEGARNKKEPFNINEELFGEMYDKLNKLRDKFKMTSNISFGDILRVEGVVVQEVSEADQKAITDAVEAALNMALENLILMRSEEGKSLHKDILSRIEFISNIVSEINRSVPAMAEKYKNVLESKMKDLMPEGIVIDEARFYTELAISAEKSDVTEELVRLESHLKLFKDTLNKNDSIGKKLDFILQEMNREANTIGSKASDVNLTKEVIDIKNEIEKIREQVQNVE